MSFRVLSSLLFVDHVTEAQNSTGTSTASESELVEQMETMNLIEHKEFYATKKPKKRKKQAKKRKNSLRCQKSPESNVFGMCCLLLPLYNFCPTVQLIGHLQSS